MLRIDEIGTVSERIAKLINHFSQGNKTAFGRAADIQSGVLAGIVGGRESKPGFEILQKLLTAYPTINPKWLLFGHGEMLYSGPEVPVQLKREVDSASTRLELLKEQLSHLRDAHGRLTEKARSMRPFLDNALSPEQKAELDSIGTQQRALVEQGRPIRQEIDALSTYLEYKNKQFDYLLDNIGSHQPTVFSVYRVKGEPDFSKPYNGLLTQRLGISEMTAQQLIAEGKLRAVEVGDEGYRVTERAVGEFLGEAPTLNDQ